MVPIPGRNRFHREQIKMEDVQKKFEEASMQSGPTDPWTLQLKAFLNLLERLDWTKTAIFYEETIREGGGNEGWKVVHFINQVEEQWHDICGMTWFGISAHMM